MKNITTWVKCDCCDDYLCNFHGNHVFECDCPTIVQWAEYGLNPYFDEPEDKVIWFLENVKLEDE